METTRAAVVRADSAARVPRRSDASLTFVEILFGIALPLVCLLADPCVFKTTANPIFGLGPDPFFPHWHAAAWGFVLVECGALVAYALWRPRRDVWHALCGGLFLVGALSAFALGVVLAPFALAGTALMGIGLLGLVPFITAIVFLYRGLRAFGRGRVWRGRLAPLAVLVGMCVGIGVPVGAWGTGRAVMRRALFTLELGEHDAEDRAIAQLRRWRFLVYPDDLVARYERTADRALQARLAAAYKSLTGEELEKRLEERELFID